MPDVPHLLRVAVTSATPCAADQSVPKHRTGMQSGRGDSALHAQPPPAHLKEALDEFNSILHHEEVHPFVSASCLPNGYRAALDDEIKMMAVSLICDSRFHASFSL